MWRIGFCLPAWQLPGVQQLTGQEALASYERNWRHVNRALMSTQEAALLNQLVPGLGAGALLV